MSDEKTIDDELAGDIEVWRARADGFRESVRDREDRRGVVTRLREHGYTYEEIGQMLGITRQRVWQIDKGL